MALEPGAAVYFNSNPAAVAWAIGGSAAVPLFGRPPAAQAASAKGTGTFLGLLLPGLGLAAGYEYARTNSDAKIRRASFSTHHAYGALTYRFDDLERLAPWLEAGAGYFVFLFPQSNKNDLALHLGAGLDWDFGRYFVGAFGRYEIYVISQLTNLPAGIAFGLRVGARIPW